MIDGDRRSIGHDVARRAAVDVHRLQTLVVAASLDLGLARLVRGQDRQQLPHAMDGVATHPRACGVRPCAAQRDDDAHRALTPRFEGHAGGFAEQRHVGRQQLGTFTLDRAQAVVLRRHFFALVEHERDVDRGLDDGAGELEHDRQPTFHVGRAEPPQRVAVDARGGVVVDGHGVGVTAEHHPVRPAELRAGDQVVADARHFEMR